MDIEIWPFLGAGDLGPIGDAEILCSWSCRFAYGGCAGFQCNHDQRQAAYPHAVIVSGAVDMSKKSAVRHSGRSIPAG